MTFAVSDRSSPRPRREDDEGPAIDVDGLTTTYGGSRGITDLTFQVERGEVFGFIGANGAGKTTMIRTLLDLLRPAAGTAHVLGLDSHADAAAIHARVGNLPGGFGFDQALCGRELLRYLAALRGLRGLGRAAELARRLGADLERPLGELSRGNRQKIGVIQALFHDPELLILDEPTSGLDPLVQETFLELVAETRAAGRTTFISSHNLAEVQRVCDRVAVIRDGRLLAVERVSELAANAPRRVRVSFEGRADPALVAGLRGVSDVRLDDAHTLCFSALGDVDPVLHAITQRHVTDLTIEPADLEDTFLQLYGAGREKA